MRIYPRSGVRYSQLGACEVCRLNYVSNMETAYGTLGLE